MPRQAPGPDVAAAFAEIAETLASDMDIEACLAVVCRHSARLLAATSAAIVFTEAPASVPSRIASSDELGRRLAVECLSGEAGPWADCFSTGQLIAIADLRSGKDRWPRFARGALRAGVTAATVVPVRSHPDVVGALAVLGKAAPDATGIHLMCSLADAAGAGIVLADELRRQERAIAQLQAALTSRIVIEQAKGVLAERWKVDPDEAFDRLRRYARSTQRRLSDLALAIIKGTTEPTSPDQVEPARQP